MTYNSPTYREPQNPMGSFAELCAGVGRFRTGLPKAGWKTFYSNQWEPSTKTQHPSNVCVAKLGPESHSNDDIARAEKTTRPVLFGGDAAHCEHR